MKKRNLIVGAIVMALGFIACEKEELTPDDNKNVTDSIVDTIPTDTIPTDTVIYVPPFANGVFITNEGGYTHGNGSVSFYDIEKDSVSNEIFKTVNEVALGDVVQSMYKMDSLAYICVNNSAKIEVVKHGEFESFATIEGLTQVRYFVGEGNKGYATIWGEEGAVKVIDLVGNTVTKTISVGNGPEQMVIVDGKVYVVNSGGFDPDNTVSVIDMATDEVVNTITVGDSPSSIVADEAGNIYVLCQGLAAWTGTETASKLYKITSSNNEVELEIDLFANAHPQKLGLSPDATTVYVGGGYGFGGIYTFDVADGQLSSVPMMDNFFYGFLINPDNGNIFACEAPDWESPGTLYRYSPDGTLLGSYEVGIGPNGGTKRLQN